MHSRRVSIDGYCAQICGEAGRAGAAWRLAFVFRASDVVDQTVQVSQLLAFNLGLELHLGPFLATQPHDEPQKQGHAKSGSTASGFSAHVRIRSAPCEPLGLDEESSWTKLPQAGVLC